MNKARDLKNIVLGAVLTASGLSALAAVNLTTFTPGTSIKSSEVNANFTSLKANIEALQAPGGISGAQLAAGSVDTTKLATTGTVADGKVLKLQSGNLIWGDDLVGTGGTTFTADGTSLALTGTIFSIKDAGVSNAKLANSSVTSSKIAFPLSASGAFGGTGLAVTNSAGGGLSGISGDGGIGILGRSSARGIVGTQGDLAMSCGGTYAVGGCATDGNGVLGNSTGGIGVLGNGTARGVVGTLGGGSCAGTYAVGGCGGGNIGVLGRSTSNYGVYGESSNTNAVYGVTVGSDTNATAIGGTSVSGFAAYFEAGNGSGGFATCTFHAGTTNWACSSDRNLKDNFKPVNTNQVLEAVAKMPVTTWTMKGSTIRQLGPTAQDFYAAFKLGTSDKSINNTDAQGVALAAIKGLYQENQALKGENRSLNDRLATLESRLAALEKSVRSR